MHSSEDKTFYFFFTIQNHIQHEFIGKILDLVLFVLPNSLYSLRLEPGDFYLFSYDTKCNERKKYSQKHQVENICGKHIYLKTSLTLFWNY